MADRLQLKLFGSPRITWQGKPVTGFVSNKVRALLIYLAVTGRAHSRDHLAELLWADTPATRRENLKKALSNLRRREGVTLVEEGQHLVALDPTHCWVDVAEFERLATTATPDAVDSLQRAVQLYQDDFLTGFNLSVSYEFEVWALGEQTRLKEQMVEVLRRLAEGYAQRHELPQAIATMRRLLQLEPWREEAHRQLMTLLAHNGDRSAALKQFDLCQAILAEELGVEPGELTVELATQIREGTLVTSNDPTRASITLPTPTSIASAPNHNLPAPTTPLIGRQQELAELDRLLNNPDSRLITIIGAGGMGKTRLALAAAQQQVACYTHGVYFVTLAPLTSVEHIVPAIAEAIQFQFQSDGRSPKAQLFGYLRQKQMLLILDNFEQLLSGAALVHELLQASPGLTCLVTTRERLQLSSETVFPLGSLGFPNGDRSQNSAEYGAVELFVQTARRVYPSFQFDSNHSQDVVRICQLVGGMPLGVILAASWVEIITPAEIAAELTKGFHLLDVGLHDIPDRQRNMRVMLAYSWQQLTAAEHQIFMLLSVFHGGFTYAAAQAVSGVSLSALMRLINKSFVQRARDDWYELHELLRQYGAEQLNLKPNLEKAARDRHCAYYCQLLQQQEGRLKSSTQQLAFREIEANLQNIRVAWQWAVSHNQVDRLAEAQESLNYFYHWQGMAEDGESACRQASETLLLSQALANLRLAAQLQTWQGLFIRQMGKVECGEGHLRQSITILDSLALADQDIRSEKAFALLYMGGLDREEAKQFRRQSLALYQALNDKWGVATALQMVAGAYQMLGEHTKTEKYLQASLQKWQEIGYELGVVSCLRGLGLSALNRGEHEKAEQLVQESLIVSRQTCSQIEVADTLRPLSTVLLNAGKFHECIAALEECFAIYDFQGRTLRAAVPYSNLSQALLHIAQFEQAQTLATSVLAEARQLHNQFKIGYTLIPLMLGALATKEYDQAAVMAQECVRIWQATGYYLFLGQSFALAGFVSSEFGDYAAGAQFFTQAVTMSKARSTVIPLLYALPGTALLLAKQGNYVEAIQIYASALCHPHVANSHWFEDVVGRHIARVAQSLPPEVVTAAQTYGQKRDLWQTAAEVLDQLTAPHEAGYSAEAGSGDCYPIAQICSTNSQ